LRDLDLDLEPLSLLFLSLSSTIFIPFLLPKRLTHWFISSRLPPSNIRQEHIDIFSSPQLFSSFRYSLKVLPPPSASIDQTPRAQLPALEPIPSKNHPIPTPGLQRTLRSINQSKSSTRANERKERTPSSRLFFLPRVSIPSASAFISTASISSIGPYSRALDRPTRFY
jgi:hypothetical protein